MGHPAQVSRKVLLGLHNKPLREMLKTNIELQGGVVTEAETLDAMLDAMGVRDIAADAIPQNHFDVYLMDLNLGSPNAPSCDSAQAVYRHVQGEVETGRVKFLGISGNETTLEIAAKYVLPHLDTKQLKGPVVTELLQ